MMKNRVLIFGAGPVGLMAAHAAARHGKEVNIISFGSKSSLYGAQYLHHVLPGMTGIRSTVITHRFSGTEEGYRAKVYGHDWHGIVSPQMFRGEQEVWDLRQAYQWLWERYSPLMVSGGITTGGLIRDQAGLIENFDQIISSIPLRTICGNPDHKFNMGSIYAIGDAPDADNMSPIPVPDDTVVCNGEPDVSWYRASKIFGHSTAEWPYIGRKRPPISGVVMVQKPLDTDCNCFPWMQRVGRYGKWQKGVLSHDAYADVEKLLA